MIPGRLVWVEDDSEVLTFSLPPPTPLRGQEVAAGGQREMPLA